jgi:hypothetical protein
MKTLQLGDPNPVRGVFPVVPIQAWSYEPTRPDQAGETSRHPFQPIDVSDGSHLRRIQMHPGLVNSVMPVIGTAGPELDDLPAPTLDLPVGAGSIFLGLTLNTAGGIVSGGAVISALLTDPSNAGPLRGYQRLATFETTSSGITALVPLIRTNLGYRRCRRADHVFWMLG